MSIIQLTIPIKFSEVLNKNTKYEAETLRLIKEFSEWIKSNTLEFFPEYTDHGIEHIQSVLNKAEEIINDDSWLVLTAEDIFVLVSSILLHDCAMHIDTGGLWSLLENERFNRPLFKNKSNSSDTWHKKWITFEKLVRKFEEEDWVNFFGENYEIVKLPKINDMNLSHYQKIIIGDFLRRHHAELAQVIATYGIPTSDNGFYTMFNSDFSKLNELSGFIARSHNYNLRDMVDDLGESAARRYLNTHPTFLMGVLRIADYLQFEKARTPKVLFDIKGKGMCSPYSQKEWKKHLAIEGSHQYHNNKEVIYIEANPDSAGTLEEINNLFKGFQKELDFFWAVNGEIYSRYDKLSTLGIKLRRIMSNLDNPYKYIEETNKNFHPEILKIKSDNQKILPLLVAPLYGDIPQIGLRELIQNSVDACNERHSLKIEEEVNLKDIPHNINIEINMDDNTFSIEDEGIGMDIEVIKDYFLKIGASYRYSEVWKATHSGEDKIYVPRTGKFGIGMLAGFLIGDNITVISRRENSKETEAVKFSYTLHESQIQVDFTTKKNIGTKIIIHSNKEKLSKLIKGYATKPSGKYHRGPNIWNSLWYYLDTPKINIFFIENNNKTEHEIPYTISKKSLNTEWNCVEDTTLEAFYWRINEDQEHRDLLCNGVLIRNFVLPEISINFGLGILTFKRLEVLVFDNQGQFPLNLTRDGLIVKDFFENDKLRNSVLLNYFQSLKRLAENFSNDKTQKVQEVIEEYNKLNCSSMILPFVFYDHQMYPLISNKLINKYIYFDIDSDKRKKDTLEQFVLEELNNVAYGRIANTQISNIMKFFLDNKNSIDIWIIIDPGNSDKELREMEKRKKIFQSSYESKLVISSCDISLPIEINSIVNKILLSVSNFAIIKIKDSIETEYIELWEKNVEDMNF